jgi:SAM-dependent methyltransferase
MVEQRRAPIPAEAAAYERYGVPRGAPFTPRLLALAPPWPGARVLDLACGTGVVARAVAPLVGPAGWVVAVDRSAAMVAATRLRAREEGAASLHVAAMDAQALAVADGAFDLSYCQFGLMLMADSPRAAAELARVVRPGGAVAAAVWSVPAQVVGIAAYFEAVQAAVPGAWPVERHPAFSLAAPETLAALLATAGLRVEREERIGVEDWHPSLDAYWAWVSEVLGFPVTTNGGWAMRRIVDYPPAIQQATRAAALNRVAAHARPDGRLALPSEALLVVARRQS